MKKTGILTVALVLCCVLISIKIITFANKSTIKNDSQIVNEYNASQDRIDEGKKISEASTTWGEFLNSYKVENPQEKNYNPRQGITIDYKVRVVKTEYHNGYDGKAGYYSYALVTRVFDEKTGELLTSAGFYKNR